MAILTAPQQKQLRDVFGVLPRAVTLLLFVNTDEQAASVACQKTRDLMDELAGLSDEKVRLEVHDLAQQPPEATLYGIDKAPALVVLGDDSGRRDFGIRFYGSPNGYEFATLIEDIRMASRGTTSLAPSTVDALSHLTAPLHLQVFVTPTCPYCPRAVLLAHQMAMASDWITADAVDATEFPDLADHYHVQGVPRTVINEAVHIEGAVPEAALMAELIPLLDANASAEA